jgi:hypothetical protein
MGMMITLRQGAILRGSRRSGRIALGRPAVCITAIRPKSDLRAPMHKSSYVLGERWNAAVRLIREKLKML